MGIIVTKYKEGFLKRYDKDPGIPYYSFSDFPGLSCESGFFLNSEGVNISYFWYAYPNVEEKMNILFCPGMGPGHTAYLSEIQYLCSEGYKVLTLDYTGCGSSGGLRMTSVNAPVRDAVELLRHLGIKDRITPVGHSLGGYTALSLSRILPFVTRAVVLSGFVSISDEMMGMLKFRFLADRVRAYERKLLPEYGSGDNARYLKTTKDRILWIHSKDDPMVNYRYNAGQAERMNNPNVTVVGVEGKGHNPNYSAQALTHMHAWIGEYMSRCGRGDLSTLEEKKAFFDDKPISEMTEQDPQIWKMIIDFLKADQNANFCE